MQPLQALEQQIDRHQGYLRCDPDNLLLRLQIGDLHHQAGHLAEAVACYEECLRRDPTLATARSRLASVMLTRHDFSGAESQLRGLLAEPGAGEDPAPFHNLGLALYFQERWADAQACFDRAARAGLDEPGIFRYQALASHHMGQMPAAIEAARRWVALSPESKSLGYLALLYMDNNDAESAREAALRALADDPENADANVVHGMALTEKQEVGQARRHFETALHQEPLNGRAWLGLGLSYLYEADYDKAIEALRKAARIYPGNPGTIVALGWAELSARDPAAAQRTFEQAIRVDRNFGESHGGLAAALAMQQKIDEAQAEILIAQRLDRRGFGAEFARSAIMAIQGDQQGASSALTRLLDQTPPNSLVPLIEQLRIYAAKNAAQPAPTQTRH